MLILSNKFYHMTFIDSFRCLNKIEFEKKNIKRLKIFINLFTFNGKAKFSI